MKDKFAALKRDIAQERLHVAKQKFEFNLSVAQILIELLKVKQLLGGR